MLPSFKNILIPVDFTVNTEVAINKTLELLSDEGSVIHLLHVSRPVLTIGQESHRASMEKLHQWRDTINDYYPAVSVQIWTTKSISVQKAIYEKSKQVGADLIVIGQTSTHNWLPVLKTVLPMRLATSTNIPVLTVKPGALHNKARTIVVPIADEIPAIKVNALELLCRKNRLNVHLVTFVDGANVLPEVSASALLKVYQLLKSKLHCPVEYSVIHGANKAKALLQYAENNNADILLVYPKKETQLAWWNQHIHDVLPADSKMQILAVQPTINSL
jgi:nucleotide-binding universal stress UspA family protein